MKPVSHPFLEWDAPIAFAHRGGASDAPENTMEAFQHAVDLGYRYVETDVQVTADGVLVAFHDDNLARTCGRNERIGQLPWSQVRTARVNGLAPIPLLEDLLGTWPELRVNIDCKNDAAVDALVAAIRRTRSLHRVCVGAFNDARIRRLRAALGPRLCSSLAPLEVARLRFGLLRSTPAHAVQVPAHYGPIGVTTEALLRRARALGLQVHVWTIDDPQEMGRLLDLGVDGLMTDRLTVLREVLEQRQLWR